MVTHLVTELFVDALEVVQAHAQYRHPVLQAATVDQDLVQLLLQLLAVGQASQEVVLGHALQAVFRFVTQVGVALDRSQQLVGRVDPKAQFVLFVPLQQRDLVLAGAVGVDLREVLDDLRQRLGQQPVVDQVQHQAHGQGAQYAGDEDDDRVDQEIFTIRRGVEGDAEVAVIFAVGAAADQLRGVGTFLAENQVGQPAHGGVPQRPGLFCQHGFIRVADGRHAYRLVLEQAFHHLHAHFTVEAVHRLGRRVAEHVEDALGIVVHGLAGLVGVVDNLRTAEQYADRQRRQQHDPEQLDRQAVPQFQLQWGFLNPCAWHHFAINDDDTLSAYHEQCIGCLPLQLECAVSIFQRFDVSALCRLSKQNRAARCTGAAAPGRHKKPGTWPGFLFKAG